MSMNENLFRITAALACAALLSACHNDNTASTV